MWTAIGGPCTIEDGRYEQSISWCRRATPGEPFISHLRETTERGKNARPLTFMDRPRTFTGYKHIHIYAATLRAHGRGRYTRFSVAGLDGVGGGRRCRRVYFSLFTVTTFSASSFRQAGGKKRAATGERFFRSEPATRGNTYDYTSPSAAAFTCPGSNIVKFVFINV